MDWRMSDVLLPARSKATLDYTREIAAASADLLKTAQKIAETASRLEDQVVREELCGHVKELLRSVTVVSASVTEIARRLT